MEVELYVKEHNITGMKYLGKHDVGKQTVYDYSGSGIDWVPHLEQYGNDVTTHLVGKWNKNDPELKYVGLAISEMFDIVNSPEWANRKPENGHDGGFYFSPEDQSKYSKLGAAAMLKKYPNGTMFGRKHSDKSKQLMREAAEQRGDDGVESMNTPKAKQKRVTTFKKIRHQKGSANSQFGTKVIHKEEKTIRIDKNKLSHYLNIGWKSGPYKKRIKCVHCGVICDNQNAKRWHGDNCKLNDSFWEEW